MTYITQGRRRGAAGAGQPVGAVRGPWRGATREATRGGGRRRGATREATRGGRPWAMTRGNPHSASMGGPQARATVAAIVTNRKY